MLPKPLSIKLRPVTSPPSWRTCFTSPSRSRCRNLVRQSRIARQLVSGLFLYCAPGSRQRRQQLLEWQVRLQEPGVDTSAAGPAETSGELRAVIVLFSSLLDERQRRLYAGLESFKLGCGGDLQIAEFLQLDPHTVAKRRRQLMAHDVEVARGNHPNRKAVGARYRRRPHKRIEVDPQDDPEDCRATPTVGDSGESAHDRPIAPPTAFFASREP